MELMSSYTKNVTNLLQVMRMIAVVRMPKDHCLETP
jgi:hypothetical protein